MVVKPPYAVPSMLQIRKAPRTGRKSIGLFAGAGGSTLGTEMAGFSEAMASEFVPAARATYEVNFPRVPIDARDVRDAAPGEFLEMAGIARGELDLLTGSPPCSGFSELVRKNSSPEERRGQIVEYSDTRQRTDDLFWELARMVDGMRPKAFVAENVESLVEGTAAPIFYAVLARLKGHGYRVKASVLDAQWLGVPQMRKRVFLVGFREDLGIEPEFPLPRKWSYSLREAMRGLPRDAEAEDTCSFVDYAIEKVWRDLNPGQHRSDKYFGLYRQHWDRPANAVTATAGKIGGASIAHPDLPRKFTVPELKRICSFPDDFQLVGTYQQQVERLGRAVPPLLMFSVAEIVARQLAASAKE